MKTFVWVVRQEDGFVSVFTSEEAAWSSAAVGIEDVIEEQRDEHGLVLLLTDKTEVNRCELDKD